jgi:hypothetical protein
MKELLLLFLNYLMIFLMYLSKKPCRCAFLIKKTNHPANFSAHPFFQKSPQVLHALRHLMRMRNFTAAAILLIFSLSAFSQGRPARSGVQGMNNGRFYGRIVDEKNDKGIDAASVQLIASKFDSLSRTRRDTIIAGMLTHKSGDFSLENLPVRGRYRLSVSAIGFKSVEQPVSFNMNFSPGQDMSQAMAALDKDLGQ